METSENKQQRVLVYMNAILKPLNKKLGTSMTPSQAHAYLQAKGIPSRGRYNNQYDKREVTDYLLHLEKEHYPSFERKEKIDNSPIDYSSDEENMDKVSKDLLNKQIYDESRKTIYVTESQFRRLFESVDSEGFDFYRAFKVFNFIWG